MSIEKGRAYFRKLEMEERVIEFPVSSATVELAAQAAGVFPAAGSGNSAIELTCKELIEYSNAVERVAV